MEIDELAVKITGDSSSLQSAMNQATDSMGRLGINTSTLTGLLGAAGLTAAFKMAYDAADKMIAAYRDDETAQLKYNAALAASAVITAQGKKALDEYVPVFASLAGIAEADTQAQIARLAAYGRTDEQIKTMMETALGMATVLDMDVNTALTQLNMTFQGTAGRLGQQTAGMKDLTEEQLKNGDGLRLLNGKYGEFAGTLKNSTDISIKNFENAYSDLMSTMGQSIAVTIQPLRDAMTSLFREIIKQATDTNSTLTSIATGFNNFVNIFKQGFLSLIGRGDVFKAIDEAVNHTEQKIRSLTTLYAGLEDPIQKRKRLEQEAEEAARQEAQTTANAAKANAQAVADAQIKGRKDAEEAYRSELAATDTRVKQGLITEQEAADAKYAANLKLINDLIALGYTGDAESKQIGDKTLADAVARNKTLLDNTTTVKDAILAGNYEIYLQEQDVAAWEKKYLEDKKKTTVDQVLYLVEFERVEREQALLEYQAYLDEMTDRAKLQAEKERIENEQKLIEYQAYLDTMTEKATYQATLEQIVWDQKTIDYEQHLTDMQAAADYAAELERIDNEQKLIEYQAYLNDMTTASAYQAEVEKIAYEQRSVEYQAYLDDMTDKAKLAAETERIEQEQRLIEYQAYLDDMEVKAKLADEKERIEQEQKLIEYQAYLDDMAKKAAYQTVKEQVEYDQRTIDYQAYLDDMTNMANLADEKERIANEQKFVAYQAYLDERTDQAKLEEEKARIENEQKLVEYQAYLDTMADADKYQTEKAKVEYDQRTIEYAQYLSDMSDKATYQVEIEKVASEQRSIEIAASYEEYLADMTDKATKADIAAAEYARAVEDADVESKKSSLQRKIEAIQAQLDKELLLVGDNENAKKILIDTADKAISDATEADAEKNSRALQRAYNKTFNIIAEGISSISSLISAQTDAAVEAVEDRLAALKESYGSTASELKTMYDALEKMGATDAAATTKAQMEKEKAVEDYASLSQAQLAILYASAIEMNDAESIAAIEAARARVKAEDDAAADIKAIKYDGEMAAWNMKLLSTTASAAQAAMDAYTSLVGIPVVGPVLAPIAAGAAIGFGLIQLAAVNESKPKLDTGGVVRAREGASVTVGAGTSEVMFGTSALGDPLMKGFMDGVASRVMEKLNIPINIPLTLNGKIVAEEVMYRVDNGLVRRTGGARR